MLSFFFFFKQKMAYEMRFSYCSSDVCFSYLFLPISGRQTAWIPACVTARDGPEWGQPSISQLSTLIRTGALKGRPVSRDALYTMSRTCFPKWEGGYRISR